MAFIELALPVRRRLKQLPDEAYDSSVAGSSSGGSSRWQWRSLSWRSICRQLQQLPSGMACGRLGEQAALAAAAALTRQATAAAQVRNAAPCRRQKLPSAGDQRLEWQRGQEQRRLHPPGSSFSTSCMADQRRLQEKVEMGRVTERAQERSRRGELSWPAAASSAACFQLPAAVSSRSAAPCSRSSL